MSVYHQWLQRRRSRGAVGCTPVPRRCRGLTEIVTAHAVKSATSSRAGVLFRSRSHGASTRAEVPVRSAVSLQHRDQSGGVGPQRSHGVSTRAEVPVRSRGQLAALTRAEVPVRSADPFSVNPGRSPGMGKGAACTAVRCR